MKNGSFMKKKVVFEGHVAVFHCEFCRMKARPHRLVNMITIANLRRPSVAVSGVSWRVRIPHIRNI